MRNILGQQGSFVFDGAADVPAASLESLTLLFDAWEAARVAQERPLSPASLGVYRPMWIAWCTFLVAERQTLDSFDAGLLERYLVQRMVSDRYARRMIVLVDWLCEFDSQREEKNKNTAAASLLLQPRFKEAEYKRNIPLPQALTDAQAQSLLNVVMTPVTEGDWRLLRNNAMVAVMLGAGLKPGETLKLTLDAVAVEDDAGALPYRLTVQGKDGPRQVPLARYAQRILASWLMQRSRLNFPSVTEVETMKSVDMMFPASLRVGKALNDSTFSKHFILLLEQANIFSDRAGAHRLRHTFATRNLRSGKGLPTVRDWLGLKTLESTERYRRLVTGETSVV